jgi:hypothetical protein
MSEDFKCVDVVMFALEEKGPNKGQEVPGSAVKVFRMPENLASRKFGRYSGPWQDWLLGMAPMMKVRLVERTKKKPAFRTVDPWTSMGSVGTNSWPTKQVDITTGGLMAQADGKITRFSALHAKYFKDLMTNHYRHGTMRDLDDETSEAIYMDEQHKFDALVGKIVAWELRPYIKTAIGHASGVDDFRLQLVEGVGDSNDSDEGTKKESGPKAKGFPKEPVNDQHEESERKV